MVDQLRCDTFGSDLFSVLTESQNLGLCEEVAHQKVMHGALTGRKVLLWTSETNEISWNKASALVDQLEESVLAICARLTPVNFASASGNRGAVAVD